MPTAPYRRAPLYNATSIYRASSTVHTPYLLDLSGYIRFELSGFLALPQLLATWLNHFFRSSARLFDVLLSLNFLSSRCCTRFLPTDLI